jgi:hypothetical protein
MRTANHTISPAEYVLGKFGGITATASALGFTPSTVQGWKERDRIPQDHWLTLIEKAKERGDTLALEDFVKRHPAPEMARAS